jgi:hypothetical protein
MSYNEKYLKYKNKYLSLKDLVGGFTYDLKDPKQKEKATNALMNVGVAPSKIVEVFDSIKKYKSVKRNDAELPYEERFHVKLIHGHLKFFYEDELKNLYPIPKVMSQNERRDKALTDTSDKLPDHLPPSELSPVPPAIQPVQRKLPPAYGLFGSPSESESLGSLLEKSSSISQSKTPSPSGLYGDMNSVKKYYSY